MIDEIFVKHLVTIDEFLEMSDDFIKSQGKEYGYGINHTWLPSHPFHPIEVCNRIAKTMVPKVKRIREKGGFDPKTTKIGLLAEGGFDSIFFDSIFIIDGTYQYKFVPKDSMGYSLLYINDDLISKFAQDREMKRTLQGLQDWITDYYWLSESK